jgi:hypothetical protein
MKVIFLDIDGVLNTQNFMNLQYMTRRLEAENKNLKFEDSTLTTKTRDEYGHLFDPTAVGYLNLLINKTDARIVISSTWRFSGLEVMRKMWSHRGLPGEVYDITGPAHALRGTDIRVWLMNHPEVDKYLILDDDCDFHEYQFEFYVNTSNQYGFDRRAYSK